MKFFFFLKVFFTAHSTTQILCSHGHFPIELRWFNTKPKTQSQSLLRTNARARVRETTKISWLRRGRPKHRFALLGPRIALTSYKNRYFQSKTKNGQTQKKSLLLKKKKTNFWMRLESVTAAEWIQQADTSCPSRVVPTHRQRSRGAQKTPTTENYPPSWNTEIVASPSTSFFCSALPAVNLPLRLLDLNGKRFRG